MMLEIIGTENCLGILSLMVVVLLLSLRMLKIDIKQLSLSPKESVNQENNSHTILYSYVFL